MNKTKRNEFYRSEINYTFLVIILLLITSGCSMFVPYTDTKGVEHTKIGDTLAVVGQTAQSVGGFIPGFGSLIGGVGGIVALMGAGITSVMSARKRGGLLTTVIKGVEEASKTYDQTKDVLLSELKVRLNNEDYTKLVKFLNDADTVKGTIKKISDMIGNGGVLDAWVQKVTTTS